jgi:hypothetical protein
VTEPGVLPLPGVTLSQEPPVAEAVKETTPGGSAIAIFCEEGVEPPENRNDRVEGVTDSAGCVDEPLTVRFTIAVCVRLPAVPVIVTPMVIGDAELVALNVSWLVPELLIAPNVADNPVGKPGGEKLTVPALKPPVGVMVIVVEALDPGATVTLLGEAERLKFGAGADAVTVTPTVVVWLRLPEVPVMVTVVGPPAAAVPLAVSVRVLPLKDAVTPLGVPDAV